MLSDAMFEARPLICHYLADDWYGTPGTPLYDRVFRLLKEMRAIQFELDCPPGHKRTPTDEELTAWVQEELDDAEAKHKEPHPLTF